MSKEETKQLAVDEAGSTPTELAPLDDAERRRDKERLEAGLTRMRSLALLMDDRFEIPIIRYRIGLDPIIGLIPGWGDWVSWAVSAYILVEAMRLKVPIAVLLKMGFHVAADLLTGYVPIVGDAIDFAYKANKRNVNIVLEHFGAAPVSARQAEAESKPAASSDDAELVHLPDTALDQPRSSALARWTVGLSMIFALAAVASVPFLLLWYLFKS